MLSYHKAKIIQQFNQAALTYDVAAVLQKEIGERLLERLDYIQIDPVSILDLGCGTGYFSSKLKQKFPRAQIVSLDISEEMIKKFKKPMDSNSNKKHAYDINPVIADAEFLPFADFSFDLIFSNFTLEWISDLQPVLSELKRVTETNGLLLFSTYGLDSLAELRNGVEQCKLQGSQHVDTENKIPYFRDMHTIGDVLLTLNFQDPVMDVEWLSITYKNADDILKDLYNSGIYSQIDLSPYTAYLSAYYEQFRQITTQQQSSLNSDLTSGKLSVTYEIIYGQAWRQDQDMQSCKISSQDEYKLLVK